MSNYAQILVTNYIAVNEKITARLWRAVIFLSLFNASHPDEDRDHHRRLVRALEEESGHDVGEIILHVVEVDRVHVARRIFDSLLDEDARFVQKRL